MYIYILMAWFSCIILAVSPVSQHPETVATFHSRWQTGMGTRRQSKRSYKFYFQSTDCLFFTARSTRCWGVCSQWCLYLGRRTEHELWKWWLLGFPWWGRSKLRLPTYVCSGKRSMISSVDFQYLLQSLDPFWLTDALPGLRESRQSLRSFVPIMSHQTLPVAGSEGKFEREYGKFTLKAD